MRESLGREGRTGRKTKGAGGTRRRPSLTEGRAGCEVLLPSPNTHLGEALLLLLPLLEGDLCGAEGPDAEPRRAPPNAPPRGSSLLSVRTSVVIVALQAARGPENPGSRGGRAMREVAGV